MNIADIKQIDIVDYLRVIGIHPTKESDFSAWYHAPYRDDRTPSFKVNKHRNIWFDFGNGKSGDIIDLACLIYRTMDIPKVLRMIADACPAHPIRTRYPISENKPADEANRTVFKNVEIKPLSSYPLISYLSARGIDHHAAKEYCKEIHYSLRGREYYALAFPNDLGGYEIRNPYYKGCVAPKGISVISGGDSSEACCLFEGFMDFLSFVVLKRTGRLNIEESQIDCIILNSVTSIYKALPKLKEYRRIYCLLDNDDSGRKTVDFLRELETWEITDIMGQTSMYKDVNDLLRDKKKMP